MRHQVRGRFVNDCTSEAHWTIDPGRRGGAAMGAGCLGTYSAQWRLHVPLWEPTSGRIGLRAANRSTSTGNASPWAGHGLPRGS